MPPQNQDYIILSASNGASCRALRGQDPPRIQSGWGGWEVTDRPKRIGATNWRGRDPLRMTLPLLFDDWKNKGNVDSEISQLERMAGSDGSKPPIISLGGVVPMKDLQWVIESMEYGSDVIFNSNGRMRQDINVTLLQYVKDVRVTEKVTKPGVPATYTTKKGDTLQKIANHFYGSSDSWTDIASANDVRDPGHIKPGTVLQLP